MGLNCGIVGLPNVGKSTLFKALTNHNALIENYPFCTVEPNVGRIHVPDQRLMKIAQLLKSPKIIPTSIEFIDIAGLVKGASKGEGLGNQFLGHIRQVDAILHVVRCFDDPNITHVHETIDPVRDIETIELELILADMEIIEKKINSIQPSLKSADKDLVKRTHQKIQILERLKREFSQGKPSSLNPNNELEMELEKEINLISLKPKIYVCNTNDASNSQLNLKKVVDWATKHNHRVVSIDGSMEAELHSLNEDEKKSFLHDLNLTESSCDQLIRESYRLLNLITFFTRNKNEVRAWEIPLGTNAQKAAGKIHTDMEKGFIRAEIINATDMFEYKTEEKVKEAGKLRVEGKHYQMQDGDIMMVRFNI